MAPTNLRFAKPSAQARRNQSYQENEARQAPGDRLIIIGQDPEHAVSAAHQHGMFHLRPPDTAGKPRCNVAAHHQAQAACQSQSKPSRHIRRTCVVESARRKLCECDHLDGRDDHRRRPACDHARDCDGERVDEFRQAHHAHNSPSNHHAFASTTALCINKGNQCRFVRIVESIEYHSKQA